MACSDDGVETSKDVLPTVTTFFVLTPDLLFLLVLLLLGELVLPCSISPTGPSPRFKTLPYGPASPVCWWTGCWDCRRKGLLCRAGGDGAEGRRERSNLGVPWSRTSPLLFFLIPLSAEQRRGREKRRRRRGQDDEGERIVFSRQSRPAGEGSGDVDVGQGSVSGLDVNDAEAVFKFCGLHLVYGQIYLEVTVQLPICDMLGKVVVFWIKGLKPDESTWKNAGLKKKKSWSFDITKEIHKLGLMTSWNPVEMHFSARLSTIVNTVFSGDWNQPSNIQ